MVQVTKFWRRTPPALFPCLLGFVGLGLAWRRAAEVWAVPAWVGEGVLAISIALFVLTFTSYMIKLSLRPSVIFDDLKVGPARGAVSAGSMCLMAIAAGLATYSIEMAKIIWWFSVLLQFIYMLCVVRSLMRIDNPVNSLNPSIMLPFVGFIVASMIGPYLGYRNLSVGFLIATLPAFVFIVLQSLINLKRQGVPVPLRPTFAIILAPVSVYTTAVYAIWGGEMFAALWWITLIGAIITLCFAGWLVKGGWTPGWGAFTFPMTSFAGAMILGVKSEFGSIATIAAIFSLGFATFIVPYVVWKTYRFWLAGKLAEATGAAVV